MVRLRKLRQCVDSMYCTQGVDRAWILVLRRCLKATQVHWIRTESQVYLFLT